MQTARSVGTKENETNGSNAGFNLPLAFLLTLTLFSSCFVPLMFSLERSVCESLRDEN